MEETAEPQTVLRVENLWAEKINGVDIFQYIRDSFNIMKTDLEAVVDSIASRPHQHSQDEIEGLQGTLESLREASQPKGSYAARDHAHEITEIKNAIKYIDESVKQCTVGYAKEVHQHPELEKQIVALQKNAVAGGSRTDNIMDTLKAINISISDVYKRLENIERELIHNGGQLSSLNKRVVDLERRPPVEIVMSVRDKQKFIVPQRALGMVLHEVRTTENATAQVLTKSGEVMEIGESEGTVIVNKPCLVHLLFYDKASL